MAIVAEGDRGRICLSPTREHEVVALEARSEWGPELTISASTQYLGVKPYGMDSFDKLFTSRQLPVLTIFSNLVQEARELAQRDALAGGLTDEGRSLHDRGTGATAGLLRTPKQWE